MKHYVDSLFITSLLYLSFGAIYAMSEIKITPKKEEIITKVSLNNLTIKQVNPLHQPQTFSNTQQPQKRVAKKLHKSHTEASKKPLYDSVQIPHKNRVDETTNEFTKDVPQATKSEQIQSKDEQKQTQEQPMQQYTQNPDLENTYLSNIRAKIEKHKRYPKIAKRLKQTGDVVISFDILKDGQIANIQIVCSSKFERLDSASIELLSDIGAFEAIPSELKKEIWNIQIPISYQIN